LLLQKGWSQAEVARHFEVSREAVRKWHDAFAQRGEAGIITGPHPGAQPKLSRKRLAQLPKMLERGAQAYGFAGDLWTTRRVADLIAQRFGVRYHPDHVGRLLHQLGLSWQQPQGRALERNEEQVRHWLRYKWPAIKRGPRAAELRFSSWMRAGCR